MASLSYEEGLSEIDSFFESPPDNRGSNVGVETNPLSANHRTTSQDVDAAPPAPSVQEPQPSAEASDVQEPVNGTEHLEENEESDTLMKDGDQVTESPPVEAANLKGRLDFILNEASATPPKITETSIGEDKAVNDKTDDGRDQSLPAGVNESEEAPITEADTASTHSPEPPKTNTPEEAPLSSPTDSDTPEPPSFSEFTLASLHSEQGLALISPKPAPHPDSQHPAVETLPSPETSEDLSSPPPDLSANSDLPAATQTPGEEAAELTPDTAGAMGKSPDMPSSEGKHSLMEEMRSEEEDSGGMIVSRTGQLEQPKLAKESGDGEATSKADDSGARDEGSPSHQILEEAGRAQQQANAIVVIPLPKTSQPRVRSDMPENHETEGGAEDAEVDEVSGAEASEAPMKSKKKVPDPKTKLPKGGPKTQLPKTIKNPVAKSSKATQKASSAQHEVKSLTQRRSARTQLTVAYKESASANENESEAEAPPPLTLKPAAPAKGKTKKLSAAKGSQESIVEPNHKIKQAVTAKRPATVVLQPQAKRRKQEPVQKTASPDRMVIDESQDTKATEAEPDRGKGKGTRLLGRRELGFLEDYWHKPDGTTGPRQTRGQRQEEEKKLPNAGKAAKERHKGRPA